MALNEKRGTLIVDCMTSGVVWSRDPANTTKRNAHLADLNAFDVKTFYVTQDGQDWLVVWFDRGQETEWGSFPAEARANKVKDQLNLRLAGGWDPNL